MDALGTSRRTLWLLSIFSVLSLLALPLAGIAGAQEPPFTMTITPADDTESVGFCNTYTVQVVDVELQPVSLAPGQLDVHATGPADGLQFADNQLDPNSPGDTQSDTFQPPDAPLSGHTTEPAAGCDTDEAVADPADDNDSDNTGTQGEDLGGGKHIENAAIEADGSFRFSLDSETAGSTSIVAWYDANDNDQQDGGEASDTASKTWVTPDIGQVDAAPEEDSNEVGTPHVINATVTDQNGRPLAGVRVRFRVVSGPHSDDDLDNNALTPAGYIGHCDTDQNGECSQTYTGTESGTDQIVVWVNVPEDETGDERFAPDADDPQDDVTKTWLVTPVGPVCIDTDPNSDTNPPQAIHDITAFVTDGAFDSAGDAADAPGQVDNDCGGDPLEGVGVTFTITDDAPDAALTPDATDGEDQETVATDATGAATVGLDNKADAEGDNTVTADVEETTEETGDTDADKAWSRLAGPVCIDTDPNSDTNQPDETHDITAFVTDGAFDQAGDDADASGEVHNDCSGAPLQGVGITFSITDDDPDAALSPDATGDENSETVATDANGAATVTLDNKGDIEGENTVTADVDGTTQDAGDKDVGKTWEEEEEKECPGFEGDPRNQVVGTADGEVLVGTDGDDIICGLGGDDTLVGEGGDDLLLGGAGADVLRGRVGDDALRGGGGRDTLRGAGGEDHLVGQGGRDVLEGGARADTLIGRRQNDVLRGQAGNDTLKGGADNDVLTGNQGDDTIRGNAGADALKGGRGDDSLKGGPGHDTCNGGPGSDSITNCED